MSKHTVWEDMDKCYRSNFEPDKSPYYGHENGLSKTPLFSPSSEYPNSKFKGECSTSAMKSLDFQLMNLHFKRLESNKPVLDQRTGVYTDPSVPSLFGHAPPFVTANSKRVFEVPRPSYLEPSIGIGNKVPESNPAYKQEITQYEFRRGFRKESRTNRWTGRKLTFEPPTMNMRTELTYVRYSEKVFLGGIPYNATGSDIIKCFEDLGYFGPLQIEWPFRYNGVSTGYVYLIFDSAESVHRVLKAVEEKGLQIQDIKGNYKTMQVIPWDVKNNSYPTSEFLYNRNFYELFVGGVHGRMTAEELFTVLSKIFGGVLFAKLDLDIYKYPLGSAVVFVDNKNAFISAVKQNFVYLGSDKRFLQLEPFIHDNKACQECSANAGPFYCRNTNCLKYFCYKCFIVCHLVYAGSVSTLTSHKPMKKCRSSEQHMYAEEIFNRLRQCYASFD